MRGVLSTVLWGSVLGCALAQHPRINEVMPSGGDALELYNPGTRPLDLFGYNIVSKGASHRLETGNIIPPNGLLLLHCDRNTATGPDHLDLKLPRGGGSVLLIAPDRKTICDMFTWPRLPAAVSVGRVLDGYRAWGFFAEPTPGRSNNTADAAHKLLSAPLLQANDGLVRCDAYPDGVIRFTTDGTIPTNASPEFPGKLPAVAGTIITVRAFAPDALPSPVVAITIPEARHEHFIALRADPADLYDEDRGILADGPGANFSRSGKLWQRPAHFERRSEDEQVARAARLAISGSGTRSLPKKNFKVFLTENGEEGPPAGTELMLRGDAAPHAFLRNLFMERFAGRGSHVDAQPSAAFPLYLNGEYRGTYRSMPAKNGDWLRSLCGAESVDVIDGPGARSLKGNGEHHERMIAALMRGAPVDSLEALLDVTSLIDLACFDVWTGRADHDLNTRSWRPRERGGRWRWILYDMDLWAPPDEGTVERMLSSSAPGSPYLKQLIDHPELSSRFLARFCAWQATALAPDRATALADSLFVEHATLMHDDHARWSGELQQPAPVECISALHAHITERPEHIFQQLRTATGKAVRNITVRVLPPEAGSVSVEDLHLTSDERAFSGFAGAPMRFNASPAAGFEFVGWEGKEEMSPTIVVDPAKTRTLKAVFTRVTGKVQ